MRKSKIVATICQIQLVILGSLLNSCDNPTEIIETSITGVTPIAGVPSMEVVIQGHNFDQAKKSIVVHFNEVEAKILKGSNEELVVSVPAFAKSGPISLTIDGKKIKGPNFRIYEVFIAYNESMLGKTTPKLWHNGTTDTWTNQWRSSLVFQIAIFKDEIYGAGYFYNGTNVLPALWTNGSLGTLSTNSGSMYDIWVDGNGIFGAGYGSSVDNQAERVKFWLNGLESDITDGVINQIGVAIQVESGDVYIGGFTQLDFGRRVISYWKNGVRIDVSDGSSGADFGDLIVNNGDVYVLYAKVTDRIPQLNCILWKNGIETTLQFSNESSVPIALQVVGEDVFVATIEGSSSVLWKNGQPSQIFEGNDLQLKDFQVLDGINFYCGITSSGKNLFYAMDESLFEIPLNKFEEISVVDMIVK